jgi:hypothetical protein
VFTARYALSPYVKQIHFVFKGLIYQETCRCVCYIETAAKECNGSVQSGRIPFWFGMSTAVRVLQFRASLVGCGAS